MSGATFQALLGRTRTTSATYISSNSVGSGTVITFTAQSLGAAFPGRVIVVGVTSAHVGAAGALTAATIGGVTATLTAVNKNSTSGNTATIAFASAIVPTGTTGDIVLTFSVAAAGGASIQVYSVIDTLSATPAFSTSAVTTSSPLGSSINCPAYGTVIAIGSNIGGGGTITAMSGVAFDNTTAIGLGSGHTDFAAVQTALAMTATFSASPVNTCFAAVSFGP